MHVLPVSGRIRRITRFHPAMSAWPQRGLITTAQCISLNFSQTRDSYQVAISVQTGNILPPSPQPSPAKRGGQRPWAWMNLCAGVLTREAKGKRH